MLTFKEIENIDGVESCGSDLENNPLLDPDVTVFFKNGYRLISKKDLLGQSITLSKADDTADNPNEGFVALIHHEMEGPINQRAASHFYHIEQSRRSEIKAADFEKNLKQIVGEPLYHFLLQRHSFLAFKTQIQFKK